MVLFSWGAFRTAGGSNRASAGELRVIGRGENHGGEGKVVEDGIEGYIRRQIGCFASIWWPGILSISIFFIF